MKGLVLQSGTTAVLPRLTKAEASAYWFNTTAAVGCGNSSSDHNQVFECIRHKPAADILSALPFVDVVTNLWPYTPTVDEVLVFSSYNERKAANLPILVGNTDFEAGIYRLFAPKAPGSQLHILNQGNFVCPAAERAASGLLQGAPTWRYRYFAEFPELRLTTNPPSGAWHMSEVWRPPHNNRATRLTGSLRYRSSSEPLLPLQCLHLLRQRFLPLANTCAAPGQRLPKTQSTASLSTKMAGRGTTRVAGR